MHPRLSPSGLLDRFQVGESIQDSLLTPTRLVMLQPFFIPEKMLLTFGFFLASKSSGWSGMAGIYRLKRPHVYARPAPDSTGFFENQVRDWELVIRGDLITVPMNTLRRIFFFQEREFTLYPTEVYGFGLITSTAVDALGDSTNYMTMPGFVGNTVQASAILPDDVTTERPDTTIIQPTAFLYSPRAARFLGR